MLLLVAVFGVAGVGFFRGDHFRGPYELPGHRQLLENFEAVAAIRRDWTFAPIVGVAAAAAKP